MHRPTTYLLALLLLTAPVLSGCNKVRARVELKKGNAFYQQESYAKALPQFQKGLELDPGATFAWRSVGLTALALYRPGDANQQNREYERVAIEAFEKYLEDYPNDAKVHEYLLTMYVNSKQYDKAMAYIDRQIQENPEKQAELEGMKVSVLTQTGQLEQAAQLAKRVNPEKRAEMLYSVGVSAWDKARNDTALDNAAREKMVDLGLSSIKQALDVRPEYFEAMVYYGLLYRQKADVTLDEAKKQEYLAMATQWRDKAVELRKKSQAAAAAQAKKAAA
ncbi:MAG TPA: tetratricopeptide repeat protein [Thermoanaerobaculia bacterium]|nr:tetratricopeptide repeat protein [Thermoanaerobaculia bacterium]